MLLRLTFASCSFLFLTVYQPPCSSEPDFSIGVSLFLEDIASSPSNFFILGDFASILIFLLIIILLRSILYFETFDLVQHVSKPTHPSGHILNQLISKSSS